MGWLTDKFKILGLAGAATLFLVSTVWLGFTVAAVKRDLGDMTKDRDALVTWADKACLAAGSSFPAPKAKDRGAACLRAIQELARFKTDALAKSNTALLEHVAEQAEKQTTDAKAARLAAERTLAATQRMEKADAAVEGDRVGGDWAGAFNERAGLRPPR